MTAITMTAITDVFLAGASLPQIANLLDAPVTTVEARLREELHLLARAAGPTGAPALEAAPKPKPARKAAKRAKSASVAPAEAKAPKFPGHPPSIQRVHQRAARAVYDALKEHKRATVSRLGEATGYNETAVWNALNKMRQTGIAIHTDEQPYRWTLAARPADEEVANGTAR